MEHSKTKRETDNDFSSEIDKTNMRLNNNFKKMNMSKLDDKEELSNKIEKVLKFVSRITEVEQGIEDERKSSELFSKLFLQDLTLGLFTLICNLLHITLILAILSFIAYHHNRDNKNLSNSLDDRRITSPLWIITINNFLFKTIFTMGLYKYNLGEILITLFSPNIYFHKIKMTTNKKSYLSVVTYELNDLVAVFLFIRVYVFFRMLINFSKFYNARANRVTKMMGVHCTKLFAVKCLIKTQPLIVLATTTFINVCCIGYVLMIIEGPVLIINNDDNTYINTYDNYENCIWTVLVTMSTVGYGDFSPKTNYGRCILILTSFFGSALVSLVVITLQNEMNMNPYESNAYMFFDRILEKKEVEKKSAACFKANFLFMKRKNKFLEFLKSEKIDKKEYENLKNQLNKTTYNKIKSTKAFKNQFHRFRVQYDPFTTFNLIKNKFKEITSKIINLKTLKENLESPKHINLDLQINEDHHASEIMVKERELAIREKMLEEKENRLEAREIELNMFERN